MNSEASPTIHVSAVVLRNPAGEVLTVRKTGTDRFMFPGGKPEPGESTAAAALRECTEEIGAELDPAGLRELGVFRCRAANEPGHDLVATVFEHPARIEPVPGAEIDAVRWQDPAARQRPGDLAPLLADHVLPALAARAPRMPGNIVVFTGSKTGDGEVYRQAAARLGAGLARRGLGVVYGGGHVGLMGQVADAALEAGGQVSGVITQALVDGETAHRGLTRLEIVNTMHERKERMAALGDAFVALPGGAGTLEEFFEAWTWQHLGIHAKPVALFNVDGFWDPLLAMIDQMVERRFLASTYRDALITSSDPDDLLERMASWTAPERKWKK
ncbi:TIGR00730 family Rossman fold protein [Arthrobacter sp. JSM 101049]|uniref:TIGR00730 family Rossman fold protein n=1 Tax=Arthrobacter sp. JSM 101049 TaxID=929097 RepID=UPI003562AADE